MKKFYSFFLVAVCLFATSFAYAATRTVYFDDNKYNWSTQSEGLYVYLFNTSDNSIRNADWPGVKVEESQKEGNLFKIIIEDDRYDRIMFSCKGTTFQTPDGGEFIYDNGGYNTTGYVCQLGQVYFDNSQTDWNNVKIHNFDNGITESPVETNINSLKSWLVSVGSSYIFYSGDWSKGQTATYSTIEDKIYYFVSSDYKSDNTKNNYQYKFIPLNIYAIGSIGFKDESSDFKWNPSYDGFKLSYNGSGKFVINNVAMYVDYKDNGSFAKFRFHTELSDNWNSLGTQYIPQNADEILKVGVGYIDSNVNSVTGGTDSSWKVETGEVKDKDGNVISEYYVYDLTLDLFNNKLKIDGSQHTTGVESISVEDSVAPVEYFNLQGVRVENPENGLYIVRQGNKVSKQLIR